MKKDSTQYIEVESLNDALAKQGVDQLFLVSSQFFMLNEFTGAEKLLYIAIRAANMSDECGALSDELFSSMTNIDIQFIEPLLLSLYEKGAIELRLTEDGEVAKILSCRTSFNRGSDNNV